MPYVPIGFEQSNIAGAPYFALYNEVFDTVQTMQTALNNAGARNMTDKGWISFFYTDRNQIDAEISRLNSPYVSGTNAQTQDRGYSSINNPANIWQPTGQQVAEYIEKVYNILPYTQNPAAPSASTPLQNTNGGAGLILIAAALALAVK